MSGIRVILDGILRTVEPAFLIDYLQDRPESQYQLLTAFLDPNSHMVKYSIYLKKAGQIYRILLSPACKNLIESSQCLTSNSMLRGADNGGDALELTSLPELYEAIYDLKPSSDKVKKVFEALWRSQTISLSLWQWFRANEQLAQEVFRQQQISYHPDLLEWLSCKVAESHRQNAIEVMGSLLDSGVLDKTNPIRKYWRNYQLFFNLPTHKINLTIEALAALANNAVLNEHTFTEVMLCQNLDLLFDKIQQLIELELISFENIKKLDVIDFSEEFKRFVRQQRQDRKFKNLASSYIAFQDETCTPKTSEVNLFQKGFGREQIDIIHQLPQRERFAKLIERCFAGVVDLSVVSTRQVLVLKKLFELDLLDDDNIVIIKNQPAALDAIDTLVALGYDDKENLQWCLDVAYLKDLNKLLHLLKLENYLQDKYFFDSLKKILGFVENFSNQTEHMLISTSNNELVDYPASFISTILLLKKHHRLNKSELQQLMSDSNLLYYLNVMHYFIKANFTTDETFILLDGISLYQEFAYLINTMNAYGCNSQADYQKLLEVDSLVSLYAMIALLLDCGQLKDHQRMHEIISHSDNIEALFGITSNLVDKGLFNDAAWQFMLGSESAYLNHITAWLVNYDLLTADNWQKLTVCQSLKHLFENLQQYPETEQQHYFDKALQKAAALSLNNSMNSAQTAVPSHSYGVMFQAVAKFKACGVRNKAKRDITEEELASPLSPVRKSLERFRATQSFQKFQRQFSSGSSFSCKSPTPDGCARAMSLSFSRTETNNIEERRTEQGMTLSFSA